MGPSTDAARVRGADYAAMFKELFARLRARDGDWEHPEETADETGEERRREEEETFEGRKDDVAVQEYFPGVEDVA
jgi:hypothetical protein